MPAPKRQLPSYLEPTDLASAGSLRLFAEALTTGLLTGLVIGALRLIYTHANSLLCTLYLDAGPSLLRCALAALFIALCGLTAYFCVRREPLAGGSGIPQLELALRNLLPMPWLKVLCCKFIGTLASMCGCLSLGRAAPSIQMGAAIGCGVGSLWHDSLRPRFLTGGAVAGLTACFGAPLAGIFFAFEELRTIFSLPHLLFMGLCAGSSWLTTTHLLDLEPVFPLAGSLQLNPLSPAELILVPCISLAAAVLCCLYLAGIRRLSYLGDRYLSQPARFAIAFCIGFVLLLAFPAVLDGLGPTVFELTRQCPPMNVLLVLFAVKFLFNVISGASYAPGGLILPLLFAGALSGAVLSSVLELLSYPVPGQVLIPLGMAAFFSGCIRAPLTAAFLIAETTAGWINLPALLMVSFLTFVLANAFGAQPLFTFMRMRQLRLMRQAARQKGRAD